MEVETTKMSTRGQIVIPLDMREELGITEGTIFAVIGTDDTIILNPIILQINIYDQLFNKKYGTLDGLYIDYGE